MKICIQAGHSNVKYNSLVALRSATGAPQEVDFTVKTRNRLAEILRSKGVEVATTDANANDDLKITGTDWDLFLAIHYDADIYGDSGGFVDRCDPSMDAAADRSLKAQQKIEDIYFVRTGVKNMYKRRNINTSQYYMWRYLSDKTPCVIIECGVGQRKPTDYDMLFNQNEKVCQTLAEAICNYLGVQFNQTQPAKCVQVEAKIYEDLVTKSTERDEYRKLGWGSPAEIKAKVEQLISSQNDSTELLRVTNIKLNTATSLLQQIKQLTKDI